MSEVRLAIHSDLNGLLHLFDVSEVSNFAQPLARAKQIWEETLANKNVFVFVAQVDAVIAATCMLITAPNLLRQGRSHGFLENVMTHPDYQGRGLGKAVVANALEHAWSIDCHHVLMQSGRSDPKVHRFYTQLGFKPGLRVGYVAMRPPR
ncbi:GNAT family N-acetyltransferase [Novosphingobium sp.]|jgi:GNAT superfamily N-acetyltransferase|uniref:GNAT family N-acetyltransferase n=1 Tax=Novosphingobium sp. TaxID=1874826 RepID=UPI002FE0ADCB